MRDQLFQPLLGDVDGGGDIFPPVSVVHALGPDNSVGNKQTKEGELNEGAALIRSLSFERDNVTGEIKSINENSPKKKIAVSSHTIIVKSNKTLLSEFLKMAIPFTLTRILAVGGDYGSALIMANLSVNHLAASGLVTTIQNGLVVPNGVSLYSVGILAGQSLSKQDRGEAQPEEIGRIYRAANLYALTVSIPIVLLMVFSDKLLIYLGQDENIANITRNYLVGYSIGVPAVILSVGQQQLAYCKKDPNIVLAINLVRRVANVALAYFFSKTYLEERGIGYAYSICSWADIGMFMVFYKLNKKYKEFKLFDMDMEGMKMHFQVLAKVSSKIAVGALAELLSTMIGIFIIGNLGKNSLSAAEIVTQYDYWITIPILCAAQSCAILVSESIGRKDYDYAKRITSIANLATIVLPLLGLIVNVIPKPLAEPFIASDATADEKDIIVDKAKTLFAINSAALLLKSAYNVFSGALRGCKDVGFSAVNSFVAFGVFSLGAGSALAYKTSLQEAGIFVGRLGGMVVGTIGMASWWNRRKNKFACTEMPASSAGQLSSRSLQ